jgi:hypothetical protein
MLNVNAARRSALHTVSGLAGAVQWPKYGRHRQPLPHPRFECQALWLLLQVGLWWRELNRSLWFYVRDALDTGNTSELPGPSQDSDYAQSI